MINTTVWSYLCILPFICSLFLWGVFRCRSIDVLSGLWLFWGLTRMLRQVFRTYFAMAIKKWWVGSCCTLARFQKDLCGVLLCQCGLRSTSGWLQFQCLGIPLSCTARWVCWVLRYVRCVLNMRNDGKRLTNSVFHDTIHFNQTRRPETSTSACVSQESCRRVRGGETCRTNTFRERRTERFFIK